MCTTCFATFGGAATVLLPCMVMLPQPTIKIANNKFFRGDKCDTLFATCLQKALPCMVMNVTNPSKLKFFRGKISRVQDPWLPFSYAESPQRLVFTVGSNQLGASLSGNWGFAKHSNFACGIASAACFRMRRCSSQIVRFLKEFFERNQSLTRMPTSNTFLQPRVPRAAAPGFSEQCTVAAPHDHRGFHFACRIASAACFHGWIKSIGSFSQWQLGVRKTFQFCMRNRLSGLFSHA